MTKVWLSLPLFALIFLALGCDGGASKTNIELLQDMMDGPNVKAQEGIKKDREQPSVMTPPAHTVSRNRFVPKDMTLEEAKSLKNPLDTISGEELLKYEVVGQQKFKVYCSICHGDKADGKGSLPEVAGNSLVKHPPSLIQETYKNYPDGRIYYIITYGWGLMGNYSSQISNEKDRWAVVNYLRQVQKLNGSNPDSEKAGE